MRNRYTMENNMKASTRHGGDVSSTQPPSSREERVSSVCCEYKGPVTRLPPTQEGAVQHSYRTYHQVQKVKPVVVAPAHAKERGSSLKCSNRYPICSGRTTCRNTPHVLADSEQEDEDVEKLTFVIELHKTEEQRSLSQEGKISGFALKRMRVSPNNKLTTYPLNARYLTANIQYSLWRASAESFTNNKLTTTPTQKHTYPLNARYLTAIYNTACGVLRQRVSPNNKLTTYPLNARYLTANIQYSLWRASAESFTQQ
ncbi:hypothetical protein J6590_020886 [Homalodisca vitripennis]|nr:hypothetical protein J6590_020886 [Homalodisca vitripennis]